MGTLHQTEGGINQISMCESNMSESVTNAIVIDVRNETSINENANPEVNFCGNEGTQLRGNMEFDSASDSCRGDTNVAIQENTETTNSTSENQTLVFFLLN